MRSKLLAILAFAIVSIAAAHAQIDCPESDLARVFGQPSAVLPKAKGDFWDKSLAFDIKKLDCAWKIVARLKDGKACSIVYGRSEPGLPISQTELMVFLSENSKSLAWNKQVIRSVDQVSWFRNDNQAFAFYNGQDKRPYLHIMNKALWDILSPKIKAQPAKKR